MWPTFFHDGGWGMYPTTSKSDATPTPIVYDGQVKCWLVLLFPLVTSAGCIIDFDEPFSNPAPTDAGAFDSSASDDAANVDGPDPGDVANPDGPDPSEDANTDGPKDAGGFEVEKTVPQLDLGAAMDAVFKSLPPAAGEVTVRVILTGDYKSDTEYAEVIIDASSMGFHQGSVEDCDGVGVSESYLLAPDAVADGTLEVKVQPTDNVALCDDPTLSWVLVRVSYEPG
jgi:hypothetical protein